MNKAIRGLTLLGLFACASATQASLIQLTTSAQLSSSDTTLGFTDADGAYYADSVAYSAGGNTATFSEIGSSFTRYLVGTDYTNTGFSDGTSILYAGDYFTAGPVRLSFASGISEVGFNLEDAAFGDYTLSFTAYNGSTALGTFSGTGSDPTTLGFVGLSATGGDLITSLSVNSNASNQLLFGPIQFRNASPVPEPSSLALVALGLLGWVGFRAQRPS